jgi:serine/threonine-protein kinase
MTAPDHLAAALAGRYALERELGHGGMATVHLARDLKHDRQVAIKVLRPELTHGLGADRFLSEIRTTASLTHPHILPLFDSGASDGLFYYVMPFIEGESIRDRLERGGPLPTDEALRLSREVADALAYAHERGIIHRDIKPENILLARGHAYVADFGIARALDAAGPRITVTGMAVGTPAYMSPEQAFGEKGVDQRSDIYSLGCLVFEMLTGRPPFDAPTAEAMLVKRLTEAPPQLSQSRAGVSPAVDAAVRRAMARDADDRFQTVGRFVEALAQADASTVAPDASRSVAVLPFINMSADPDDEYFADGITEEIINALAQVDGLKVAARTSCFAFKGKHEDLRLVGEKLGVGTVLEGSVRKAGTRLRVTAQLINAADGYHLWSERYDRELVDVFALQDELAAAIAGKLRLSLTPQAARGAGPRNVEAYELLLKGRVFVWRRGRWLHDAMACFERALALDPELAEAHALLGDCHRMFALYELAPPAERMPLARASAERALALEPDQPEALATIANITGVFDWDIDASNALTDRLLARHPTHVRAMCERAGTIFALADSGPADWERCLNDIRRARALDPLNAWVVGMHALTLCIAGRSLEAVTEGRHAVALDPANFTARWSLLNALAEAGRYDETLAESEAVLAMSARNPIILGIVAATHAARGDRAAADALYQEIDARARSQHISWSVQAMLAASAGHLEQGRALVRRAIAARESTLVFWKLWGWSAFRADPEGFALLEPLDLMHRRSHGLS